jgi:hypothetical protein
LIRNKLNRLKPRRPPPTARSRRVYAISTKTIQRGTNDLEAAGAIAVVTSRRQGESNRCRALFLPVDWGCSGEEQRQIGPAQQDRSVQQSSLPIPPNSSLPLTPEAVHQASLRHYALKSKTESYNIMRRARLEILVAKKLGCDGSHILDKLHAFDELCVERLCVAEHYGTLDERLLKTARLAAKYIREK